MNFSDYAKVLNNSQLDYYFKEQANFRYLHNLHFMSILEEMEARLDLYLQQWESNSYQQIK